MSIITKGTVVTLDYKLKDEQGRVLDNSSETGSMVYIQGTEDILQGIEDAVEGLTMGDTVNVTISHKDAYGEYDPAKLTLVPRSAFDGLDAIHPGLQLQEETAQGPVLVTIKDVTDNEVQVDANHPLAGQDLHFELVVTAVRLATAEELDHGHVHSGDGHCH